MGMNHETLQNPQLPGDSFFWEAGPIGILLLHGLTATTAEVRPLAERLRQAGYTVAGPLLPGHGTTPEALNETTWHDWAWEAQLGYEHLATLCDHVFVGGESTGAALALYLASKQPAIAGVLAYAPAIKLAMAFHDLARLYVAAPLVDAIPKENVGGNALWQGYKVNPLQAVMELVRLGREARRRLPQIQQPVLVMQGRHDRTIAPDSGELVYAGVGSAVKELHWLENSGHIILLEAELEQIINTTLAFLTRLTKTK
jgi:carboxylesterase